MPIRYDILAGKIADRVAAVPNAGRVHRYQRHLTTREDVIAEFFDPNLGRINGWTCSRASYRDEQLTSVENVRVSTFVLRGFMAVEDRQATELLFQQLVDRVAEAFRPQDNLDGAVERIAPVQAPVIGYAMLGRSDSGVLCHSAELTLDVQEIFHTA